MGGKKRKKSIKKQKTKLADDEKEINPNFLVKPVATGWIRLELRLCDPPFNKINSFKQVFRSDSKILDVKQRVIDFHGRVENIMIYNSDPYPPREDPMIRVV